MFRELSLEYLKNNNFTNKDIYFHSNEETMGGDPNDVFEIAFCIDSPDNKNEYIIYKLVIRHTMIWGRAQYTDLLLGEINYLDRKTDKVIRNERLFRCLNDKTVMNFNKKAMQYIIDIFMNDELTNEFVILVLDTYNHFYNDGVKLSEADEYNRRNPFEFDSFFNYDWEVKNEEIQ